MLTKKRMNRIHKHYEKLHKEAKKDLRLMCCLALTGLTGGDIQFKDPKKLEDMVYKFTHAVTSSCKHPDWIKELKNDYKQLRKIGII